MTSRSSLNHIYRTVWNQALGAMVAVAEVATAGGRSNSASSSANARLDVSGFGLKALTASLALAWSAVPLQVLANPTGGVVIAGQASIVSSGSKLLVTTQNAAGTNHSAINWQSFSIPQGSSTYFQQPSASSTSINRVVTNTPSQLFGSLGSNGNLVLVNQAGITVGAGAVVDTAGFTASSLKMTDADALAGHMRFGEASGSGGSVTVAGSVLARAGDVVLMGGNVQTTKDSLVQSTNGATVLVAGSAVSISGRGLEGIQFDVQAGAQSAVNLGTLKGDAVGVFAGTLKHSGLIQARAVEMSGGKVVLKATEKAEVSGVVSATNEVGVGGTIHVTASKVWLQDGALLDASAAKGGGEVLVGGGWQGNDARVANAQFTLVSSGAKVKVDATKQGDAGTVVVWADNGTRFAGNISALGGSTGGNGGNVEVSGKAYLDFKGSANLLAPKGKSGVLLLDPFTLSIEASGTVDANGDGITGDDLSSLTNTPPSQANSVITVSALLAQLGNGNVDLQAPGDVNVNAPINYSGANTSLTLRSTATGSIFADSAITASGPGKLDLVLNATGGSVQTGAISTNGGNLDITSGGSFSTLSLGGAINAGAGTVSLTSGYGSTISQGEGTSILASSLNVNSQRIINLFEAGNSISGNISLTTPTAAFTGSSVAFKNSAAASTITTAVSEGAINLVTTGSQVVSGSVQSASGSVSIAANGGLSLTSSVQAKTTLALSTTNADITQSASAPITSEGLATINTGTGNINLTQASNDFKAGVNLTGGAVKVKDVDDLIVSSISQSATNREVDLRAGGVLTMPAATAIDTGTANLSLESGGSLSSPSSLLWKGANVTLKSGTDGITLLGPVSATGSLTLTSLGGISDNTGVGSVGANSLNVSAAGQVSLRNDSTNEFNSLAVTITSGTDQSSFWNKGAMALGPITTTGGLNLKSNNGAITQSAAVTTGPGTNTTLDAGTGNITLTNPSNLFRSLTIDSAAAVDIVDAGALQVRNSSYFLSSDSFKLKAGQNVDVLTTVYSSAGAIDIQSDWALSVSSGEGVNSAGSMTLRGLSGLTVSNVTLTTNGGGNLLLDSGSGLFNAVGSTGVTLNGGGVWRTYSKFKDSEGFQLGHDFGMFPDAQAGFKQYGAPFGTAPAVGATGNGRMFSDTPTLIASSRTLGGTVSKVYDGGTSISLSGAVLPTVSGGALAFDDVSVAVVSNGTGVLSDPNVGTGINVTASGLAVTGVTFDSGKPVYGYQLESVSGPIGVVTPARVVATVNLSGTRVYDGTNIVNASIFSLSGLINGETLNLSGSGTVADKNVGNNKPVNLGSIALGDGSGLASNYTLSGGTAVASITPLFITSVSGITAANKVYDGATTATVSAANAVLSGKLVADTVSISGGTGLFTDKNAGLGKTVTVTGLTLSGADAMNYRLASASAIANASIVPKLLTIGGMSASNKVYDGSTTASITGGSLSGAVTGDTVTLSAINGTFADKNVGVAKAVNVTGLSLSGADSGNYSLLSSTVSLTADITAKALVAGAFSALNKTYDGTTVASVSGGSLSGVLSGDSVGLGPVSGSFTDKNAGTGKSVTITGLALTGADARNYGLSSTTATTSANIAPKVLTTSGYQVASKVYDGNRSAAVTGGVLSGALAGDSVSLTSVVASFSDKNAGLAKPVTIAGGLLSGADAGNYSLSSSGSTATADILPRPVTVGGLSANNKVYDGTTLAVVSGGVVSGAVAGDTVSVNVGASAFADKNVGAGKLISVSGVALAGADALNYSLASTSTSLTANIAARPVTVGSISVSGKTYDGTTAAQVSGGSLLGAVSGDAVSIGALSGSFLDKNVGTNKPVVLSGLVLNGVDASNYSLNPGSVSAVASIAPRVVSVSALNASDKVYDGTTSATLLGGVLSGAVAGDNVSLAPVSGNFLDKNVGAAKPVAVSGLSLTGGDAGNYTLGSVGVNATASITPKPLVVSGITALNKPYDGKTDATIDTSKAVLSGLVAGDLVTTTEMKAAFADKNAGTAKNVLLTGLGLTGADARNYTFSGDSVTTADITVRESSNWLGAAGDLWSDPKNWDVVPEGANVRSVVFPANTSRVTLNAGAGSVSLQSFSLGGSLVVEGGSLQVAGGITTAGYAQSGGTVSTPGAFRVTGNFDQTLGSLNAASVEVTRASGDIVVGNITAPTVTLTAQSGAIRQTGAIQQAALTTRSTAGTLLPSTGNRLSSFTAANTGTGDIELVNTGVLTTSGITNSGGNIKITNTGGISSLDEALISAPSPGAKVSLTANSPLSIGAAGIVAGGDIELVATNLTSAGNITLNGPIESKAGAVAVRAANNLTQNSSVLAPLGVSAAAGGTLTLGPTATSGYQPVSYQVNSSPVTPPRSPASASSAADLVVALMTTASDPVVDRSITPLESLITKDNDKDKDRDSSKAFIVSEGQVCRP